MSSMFSCKINISLFGSSIKHLFTKKMAVIKIVVIMTTVACAMSANDMPEEWKEYAKILHDKCQEETGVTEVHIEDANNGKFADDNVLKCYMKCMMVKSTIMSEDGIFDADRFISLITAGHMEALIPTIHKCKTIGKNNGDTKNK